MNIISVILGVHSPVSRKILSYKMLSEIPEGIIMKSNVAVIIKGSEYLDGNGNNEDTCSEEEFVTEISEDGHIIILNDQAFFNFRRLMKIDNAFIYDYCGEIPGLDIGYYNKE
jgi:hypothetical protein